MIPLAIPNLCGNEARYLQECVETNFVSSVGPFVTRFEEMVANASGATYAVATSSGTTGLHAALVAVGVRPNDLVVLQSLTFIASANAIAYCGAAPWLLDSTEESWTLDPRQLERVLTSETKRVGNDCVHVATGRRVAAIMPVYTLGMPADMDCIVSIARTFRLPVVADAAAALAATYKERRIAELAADLTVFSFNGNKTVTSGGGGAAVGDGEDLCALVRHLTTTARRGAEYHHDVIGFNYRMTNVQAAVGCAQMENLEKFVGAKRRIAERYTAELRGVPGVKPFPAPPWAKSACWFSGVVVERPPLEELIPKLREHDVDARPFWKPIHLQPPYADAPRASLPFSDAIWHKVLTLPCSTSLSDSEQRTVVAAMRACVG